MLAGEAEDVAVGGQRGQQHPLWLLVRFLVEALLLLPDGLLEALLEQRQLRDEVGDGVHQRLLSGEG